MECCKTEQTGLRGKRQKGKRHVQKSEGVKEIKVSRSRIINVRVES